MKYIYISMALIAAVFSTSAKAETINCTEITAVPVVITVQGIYCLKGNLSTALTSGNMIDIQTNNVTIDFNGFKLGGLAAGVGTLTFGILAFDRKNITIRNGSIRGFFQGIFLNQSNGIIGNSSGHLIEDMLLDGNRTFGIRVEGINMVIRRNRVVNTGPGMNGVIAVGIRMFSSENSMIADNFISGMSESNTATGISINQSNMIEVRGNTILKTVDALVKVGIDAISSASITIVGNSIINDALTGTVGITDGNSSTGVKCINNTITGFTVPTFGCDVAVGNN